MGPRPTCNHEGGHHGAQDPHDPRGRQEAPRRQIDHPLRRPAGRRRQPDDDADQRGSRDPAELARGGPQEPQHRRPERQQREADRRRRQEGPHRPPRQVEVAPPPEQVAHRRTGRRVARGLRLVQLALVRERRRRRRGRGGRALRQHRPGHGQGRRRPEQGEPARHRQPQRQGRRPRHQRHGRASGQRVLPRWFARRLRARDDG